MQRQDLARATPVRADVLKTEDREEEKERCFLRRHPQVAAPAQRQERVKAETCGELRPSPGPVAGELRVKGEEVSMVIDDINNLKS